jgi:hypothetical protein
MKKSASAALAFASALTLFVSSFGLYAHAGTELGRLNCKVDGGVGLIFGSTKKIHCTFARRGGGIERYEGRINKYGIDIEFTAKSHIVWGVLAAGLDIAPGALSGSYGGATAEATFGGGLGANVLLGGSQKSIALQPLSIQGQTGLNVAGGIASLKLSYTGH